MAKVFVKMGEGIESNCNLSGTPVSAGSVVEISESDAKYVFCYRLGEKANATEVAEYLKANGRADEVKAAKPEPKQEKPKPEEVEKTEPEKTVEKKTPKDGQKTLDEMGFGELKAEAEKLGVKITKSKGRVTKSDFIEAIKAKKGK